METNEVLYSNSVLNASVEQMNRFNDLHQNAEQFILLCREGEQLCEGFINIIGDIWFSFYCSDNLTILPNHNCSPQHQLFIEHLLTLEEFKNWKILTRNDLLLSALTTLTIAEQLVSFLKKDERVRKSAIERKFAQRKKAFAQSKLADMNDFKSSKIEPDLLHFQAITYKKMLANATNQIANQNEVALNNLVTFKDCLIGTLTQSIPGVKKRHEAIVSLCTMEGRQIHHIPIKEQLKLTDAVMNNKTIIEIANIAGRFKKIAKKKMKTKSNFTMEQKTLTLGNEINRLLPLELAKYIYPSTKLDFLLRYAESQTIVYDKKGKDRRGKGPIIICMDESSSMNYIREESKAFCLALLFIAQKQKRDFAIIPFASDIGDTQYFMNGHSNTDAIMKFSQSFLGGGTNYEKPLREALAILTKSQFNEADLIFVTDGSSFLTRSFIDEFNTIKKQKKFECITIVLTNNNTVDISIVSNFSDRVIEVNNLFEAEEAFLI